MIVSVSGSSLIESGRDSGVGLTIRSDSFEWYQSEERGVEGV